MGIETIILPLAALVFSGLVWNNFGYFSAWRKNRDNLDWKGFDKTKLRNDLILGAILGVGSVVFTLVTEGDFTPITTASEFLIAVGAGFGVVAAVDKFIIGGIFNK